MAQDSGIQGAVVGIFGDEYRIATEADTAEVQRVARLVDAKMREVAARSGRIPKTSVAVLAAMEIAAEYLRAQREEENQIQRACDNLDRLNRLVEQRSTLVPLTSDWIERRLSRPVRLPEPVAGSVAVEGPGR